MQLIARSAGRAFRYEFRLETTRLHVERNLVEIDHPVEGKVKSIGFPVKLSETKQRVRRPPPLLGEHNEEILTELGIDEATREQLRVERAKP